MDVFDFSEFDYIITVPGFNLKPFHTYDICRRIALYNDIVFVERSVEKIRHTEKQKTLSLEKRKSNLDRAFEQSLFGIFKKNSKIVIFDDIITTGTTLERIIDNIHCGELYIVSLAVTEKHGKSSENREKT